MVGAVLTQNTNWGNVERAIHNLKQKKVLSLRALHQMPASTLAGLIRPAGYFNVKASRLKNLVAFIVDEYQGSLKKMSGQQGVILRQQLLGVNGIGPETADSILLYALEKPVFVIDAYTRRILSRHGLIDPRADYHALQEVFMNNLKSDLAFFNEYHALIVRLGKDFCRPRPRCASCPLGGRSFSFPMEG